MDRPRMDQYSTLFSEEPPPPPPPPPPGEIRDSGGGAGYLTGLAGALLGALAGAIPWFLVSTFTAFFVGWLGFLVGWAASWGYQKLRGAKKRGYAAAVVLLSSILAILAAEVGSWMFVLCTDPEWQESAAYFRISVARLAWESLWMPENLPRVLPGMAVGLLIGGLGILSARQKLLAYIDPERAAQTAQRVRTAAPQMAAQRTASASQGTGMPLPREFTLHLRPSAHKVGYVCVGLAGVFFLLFLGIAVGFDTWDALPVGCVLSLILLAEGLLIVRLNGRYCLKVEGERLRFVPRIGNPRTFTVQEIGWVKVSNSMTRTLYGQDGQVLAKLNANLENMILLNQYFNEHQVPLRG